MMLMRYFFARATKKSLDRDNFLTHRAQNEEKSKGIYYCLEKKRSHLE